MDNEHSNDMEKNSTQTGKDTASTVQEEIKTAKKTEAREDVPEKKPGAILAAKRIEAGITEEQIAARLKMTLHQVHYLETDNYDALHGIAISRGFVRAYARVLQIDPEPLVAQFADRKASSSPVPPVKVSLKKTPEIFSQNKMPFRKKRNLTGKFIILLVIVVIAAVVAWNMKLFSFDGRFGKKEASEITAAKATLLPSQGIKPVATAPDPGPAANTSQGSADKQTAQPVSANMVAPARSQTAIVQENSAVPLAAVVKTEPEKSAASSAGSKSSLLTMNFREKSWVQVQKTNGSVITEYIGKPGEQRQIEIGEPVTVIIGYAPGVAMEFKGAPVDLAPSTINSVARISLK